MVDTRSVDTTEKEREARPHYAREILKWSSHSKDVGEIFKSNNHGR